MISVSEATQIVKDQVSPLQNSIQKKVIEAMGHTLFSDILSPINMPPFRQSAMDGYALSLHDGLEYSLMGEIQAGDNTAPVLRPGEAVRIFTGAPVPASADAVIMQEKVIRNDHMIAITAIPKKNENIRAVGEQIKTGATALEKGVKLNAAGIGFLSSLGITDITVHKKPTVAIIVTGNELVSPGKPLQHGQIYESNAHMLQNALESVGFEQHSIFKVADNYQATFSLLKQTIALYDVLLVSGGISVGDYDFVERALQELEVTPLFYKVKQKPGKPLFFGRKGSKFVFALPGNPAASLSCFYVYVHLALQKLSGNLQFSVQKTKAKSQTSFQKKGDRAQFLKAAYENGKVTILEGQSSAMLHTFALANALVYIPETVYTVMENDWVEVLLLPINT